MPPLTSLIQVIPSKTSTALSVEDIFASAPGLIFPDDTRNTHGDPGSTIVYQSPRFGDIELTTADPVGEEERQLFSHYLWNAGIKLAGLISGVDEGDAEGRGKREWSVEGERVLELGAGVGLVGIIATLSHAREVVMTDYPAKVVLDNLHHNATNAIPANLNSTYQIQPHAWGSLDTPFATANKQTFTRILAADCLWMPSQHLNLVRSMLHFLTLDAGGRVFVVAGFHTGRASLAAFFDVVVLEGLRVEAIWEEDGEGNVRGWQAERDGGREDVTGRKKWLVIARLMR